MSFVKFIWHACLVRNPVSFPSLASIIRVGLLKVGHARGGVRPQKSNKDAFSILHVLGIKLAPPILELANLGHVHLAGFAVGPIEAPLMSFGIV